jgi:hypothetical protein
VGSQIYVTDWRSIDVSLHHSRIIQLAQGSFVTKEYKRSLQFAAIVAKNWRSFQGSNILDLFPSYKVPGHLIEGLFGISDTSTGNGGPSWDVLIVACILWLGPQGWVWNPLPFLHCSIFTGIAQRI